MKRLAKKSPGFTLVEILIVLAVLAILAAVVVPNVTGFLGRGKERAFEADQRLLQAAIDAWRTDVRVRAGTQWPVINATIAGTATPIVATPTGSKGWIDMKALSDDNYLRGTDTVKSADRRQNITAANSPSGSYSWYIDANGLVTTKNYTYDRPYPTPITATPAPAATPSGFNDGVYP